MAGSNTEDDEVEGVVKTEETHELKVPIEYKGEERTEITIRRPKLKDMKKVSAIRGSDADRAASMIQILSGWAPQAVDELDSADVDAISKIIDSFS